MRLVVELDPVITAVLTHLESGECRLSGDLFTGRYVGNGSGTAVRWPEQQSFKRSSMADGKGRACEGLQSAVDPP